MRSLALLGLLASAATAGDHPNMVVVFIDDMGWADFSCFGNTEASTPNIDRLAADGIRFEQFYVNSPICSPSRVALSTGQYPQRWRISSYLSNRKANAARGIADWLDPSAPMLARDLKRSGYVTGHFGKWHMGGQRDVHEAPLIEAYGFDESLTNFEGLGPRVLGLKHSPGKEQTPVHGLGSMDLGHGPVVLEDRSRVTETFVEAALAFIHFATETGQPFYLNLWPDDVHTPMHPPLELWEEERRPRYLRVLEEMDRQLAPLFDRIREDPGLRDNTIVLVCSDNGPEVGFGSAGRFKGCKATLYEGGIRSPLIVWAPGLMPAEAQGSLNTESVLSAIDLVPSLLALVGPVPEAAYDGEDLSGTLLGREEGSRAAPLFFRRPPDRENFRHHKGLPDLALRRGRWKVLCDYDGGNAMLYDLASDPSESTDRAHEHGELTGELAAAVVAWHRALPQDTGPAGVATRK